MSQYLVCNLILLVYRNRWAIKINKDKWRNILNILVFRKCNYIKLAIFCKTFGPDTLMTRFWLKSPFSFRCHYWYYENFILTVNIEKSITRTFGALINIGYKGSIFESFGIYILSSSLHQLCLYSMEVKGKCNFEGIGVRNIEWLQASSLKL